MLTTMPQDLSELQHQLNREREPEATIYLSNGELWQPPFCMSNLFEVIPGCNVEPIRIDFRRSLLA